MAIFFAVFAVAAVSQIALELTVVIPRVGGLIELLKLSDFGILTAAFELAPTWTVVNMVVAVVAMIGMMWSVARR